MEKTKSVLTSRTEWAGAVALVIGLLQLFGVVVPDSPDSIAGNIVGAITAVSGLAAMVFRMVAKTKLKLKNSPNPAVIILVLLALLFVGCNGPITVHDPAYLVELDKAAATTRVLAEQCYAGQIDPNDCCDGLDAAHKVLAAFSDAAHGRDVEGEVNHGE